MTHPTTDHWGKELYNFKGRVPPWTSYCRACLRREGLDPYQVVDCPDASTCPHYPFKYKYKPKED